MNRPARPQVTATVGGKAPARLGMDALLDFRMEVTLDGESLSKAEIKRLLAQSDGLAFIRGKWVEVDRERLSRTLEQFEAIERDAAAKGLSFGEAMLTTVGPGGVLFPAFSPSRSALFTVWEDEATLDEHVAGGTFGDWRGSARELLLVRWRATRVKGTWDGRELLAPVPGGGLDPGIPGLAAGPGRARSVARQRKGKGKPAPQAG